MNGIFFKTFINLRKMIYLFLARFDILFNRKNSLFILCYHSVDIGNWRFSVGIREFKKQIEFLLKEYRPISLSDLDKYLIGGKKLQNPSFLITFDDGYQDILKIKPFLKNKGIRPAVFILG